MEANKELIAYCEDHDLKYSLKNNELIVDDCSLDHKKALILIRDKY